MRGPTGPSGSGGGGGVTVIPLGSISGTISTNLSGVNSGDLYTATLTGSITLSNPSNPVDGFSYAWLLTQGSGGSKGVTLGNKFNIPSSATTPLPWSTAAGKKDYFAVKYDAAADKFNVVSMVPGY